MFRNTRDCCLVLARSNCSEYTCIIAVQGFHSSNGPAYLFDAAINVTFGESTERDMTSGTHLVRDVFCVRCYTPIGWKYVQAYNASEEYKVGKLCLERNRLVGILASSGNPYPVSSAFSALQRNVVIFPIQRGGDAQAGHEARSSTTGNPHTTLRQYILEGNLFS